MNLGNSGNDSMLEPLAANLLRWRCDLDSLPFETTADVSSDAGVVGQPTAREALEFGLLCWAPGQNVYVRGQSGTGRRKLVHEMLAELAPQTDDKRDFCYVQNFDHPDRPRLITLPAGTANDFRVAMLELATWLEEELEKSLESEPYQGQREAIEQEARDTVAALTDPLEKELQSDGMAMVNVGEGPAAQSVIVPVVDGQAIPPAQLSQLIEDGKASADALEQFKAKLPSYEKRVTEARRQVNEVIRSVTGKVRELNESAMRELMRPQIQTVAEKHAVGSGQASVTEFLNEVVDDVVELLTVAPRDDERIDLKELYGVNVVHHQDDNHSRPVLDEHTPSLINLLGTVEPQWGPGGMPISDYRGIRAGSLLQADSGYLILDVNDLLSEPGAWRALTRTLRTGQLDIVPPEAGFLSRQVVTLPESIDIHVRVVLIGDVGTFYQLDQADPDFAELFRVLADFDSELVRDDAGVMQYAQAIAQLAKAENLPAFDRSAIAALAEHGARIIARRDRLTACFGRIADIAREAAFLTTSGSPNKENLVVSAEQVVQAVRRTKSRASLPSIKFQQMVENETLLVQTSGEVVGQVNGLAVMRSGPLTYGFPARITASIGPGSAGLINIEGQSNLSGAIHTKGFHILGGLLRNLLKMKHPLCFSASLAFEQSYGGIDGDSASGAEIVCLLSALTDVPIKQGMAMTGAIDQRGHLEAIGGVNEKIEGFFDACQHFGLTGDQGVVVPKSNAGDLMLRQDVVEACRDGQFHVYAVDNIFDAVELMTGAAAGTMDSEGNYTAGSLLATAQSRATEFWRMSTAGPQQTA